MKKTLINTVVVPYLRGIDTFDDTLTSIKYLLKVVPYLRGIDTKSSKLLLYSYLLRSTLPKRN